MSKKIKRVIAFIILFMVCSLNVYFVKADVEPTENVTFSNDTLSYNGITLKRYPILEGSNIGYFDLIVTKSGLTKSLAGFSGRAYCYADAEGTENDFDVEIDSIEVKTSGWSVKGYNKVSDNQVNFIVEADDCKLSVENSDSVIVRFKISLEDGWDNKIDNTISNKGFYIDYSELVLADAYNNSYRPIVSTFNYLKEDNTTIYSGFGMDIKKYSGNDIISYSEGNENNVRFDFDNKELYIKLDGNTDDGEIRLSDFLAAIQVKNGWNSVKLINATTSEEVTITSSEYAQNDEKKNTNLQNFDKCVINNVNGILECNLRQMGNTYYDEDITGGVINIKDVEALRKAVVDIAENSNFIVKNSDVNFSNDELGTRGDAADVIAIRRRILDYEWPSDLNE